MSKLEGVSGTKQQTEQLEERKNYSLEANRTYPGPEARVFYPVEPVEARKRILDDRWQPNRRG
jgi:hypothetical protein